MRFLFVTILFGILVASTYQDDTTVATGAVDEENIKCKLTGQAPGDVTIY
jgi:hypothetical protein